MHVYRQDFGQFEKLEKIERTPQGGLRVPANLTRVGIFTYTRADGSEVRELRPPEEVFSEDSLATLAGAPVTDLHPKTPVRPTTWRDVSVGHVSDTVGHDACFVTSALMIQDADAVQKVARKDRRELSCGYACRIDATPGEWEGEPYDVVQRDIRYNHVAIGPRGWGRAGRDVAMRLDAQGNQISNRVSKEPIKETIMKVIRIDGVEYEFGSEKHLQKLESQHSEALAAEQKRADAAEGALAAEQKRADAAEEALAAATDPKAIDLLVASRTDLLEKARKVLGDSYKTGGKSDRQIRVDAIAAHNQTLQLEERSDEYVSAYFDAMTSTHKDSRCNIGDVLSVVKRTPLSSDRQDSEDRFDVEAARKRMLELNKQAASQPLRFSNTRKG